MSKSDILCGKWKGFPIVYRESDRKYYYLRDNKEINILDGKKDRGRDCSGIYKEKKDFLCTEYGSFYIDADEYMNDDTTSLWLDELYGLELCGFTGRSFDVEKLYYSKSTGKINYFDDEFDYVEIGHTFTVDKSKLTGESTINLNEIINEIPDGNYTTFSDTVFNTVNGLYSEDKECIVAAPLKFICGVYNDDYSFKNIYATEDSGIYIPEFKNQLTVPEGIILKELDDECDIPYIWDTAMINTDQGIFFQDSEDDNWWKVEEDYSYTNRIVKGVRYGDREDIERVRIELCNSDISKKTAREIISLLPDEFILCGRFHSTPIVYGKVSGRYHWITEEGTCVMFGKLNNKGNDCSQIYNQEDNFLLTEYCKAKITKYRHGIDPVPIIPNDYISCCEDILHGSVTKYYSMNRGSFIDIEKVNYNFSENKNINLKDVSILKPEEYEGQLMSIARLFYDNELDGIIVNTTKGIYLNKYNCFTVKCGEIHFDGCTYDIFTTNERDVYAGMHIEGPIFPEGMIFKEWKGINYTPSETEDYMVVNTDRGICTMLRSDEDWYDERGEIYEW